MLFKGSLDALTSFPFGRVDAPTALCILSGANVFANRQKGKAWIAGRGGRFGWITRLKSSNKPAQRLRLIDSPSVSSCWHKPPPNTTDAQQARCVLKQSEYLFVKLCWNGMSTLGYDPIKCHRFSANQRVGEFDNWMQRTLWVLKLNSVEGAEFRSLSSYLFITVYVRSRNIFTRSIVCSNPTRGMNFMCVYCAV
jgi:hypothetical protein